MTTRSNRIDLLAGTAAILLVANPLVHAVEAQQPSAAAAQAFGRVTGRIVDAETGQGLTDVGIQVVGTTIGTQSGVDGRYTLARVPAGTVTIQARRIGYAPKTITGVMLPANGVLEQNISLSTASVQLSAQVVTASAERGTVNEALDRQRSATGIVNSVTSEQIAKSPDSDAAAAVQRVSGVTVQDGRNVFVRGLGERYTTTTLNGARLPSPDPEKRSVPLDLFPAGLLQSITTSKTFTPDLSGDFSGAQVDIQTREFPARRQVTVSSTVGANAAAFGAQVPAAPSAGLEWLGLGAGDRALPALLRTANPGAMTVAERNQTLRTFRNAWTPLQQDGRPNSSLGISVGGQDPVFGHRLGYLLSGSYSYGQEVREGWTQQNPQIESGRLVPIDSWSGSVGRASVLWGGLANFSTMVGTGTRLALNSTYNRSADNEARTSEGVAGFDFSGALTRRLTMRYLERSVWTTQLVSQHALSDRHNLDWNVTSAGVTRDEPDRSDIVYGQTTGSSGQPVFAFIDQENKAARRTFGELTESSVSTGANYRVFLGDVARSRALKFGGQFRRTERDADIRQFAVQTLDRTLPIEVREQSPEVVFSGERLDDTSGVFRIMGVSQGGRYTASDRNAAGYGMLELPLGERLRIIGGARVEAVRMEVETILNDGTRPVAVLDNVDVLPSLVFNVKLTDVQNLRLSATQTLARPEYREISPALYQNELGAGVTKGNPDLKRSLIQNYDIRWERYPNPGELFSVALFAKRFQDPIERVDQATGGPQIITYANARSAINYGVELEARKGLGGWYAALNPFSVFTNVTVMTSNIDIGEGPIAGNTTSDRPMVGQAPYVVNAGATYARESGMSATVLYNVVGKRIDAAGSGVLGDIYEMPRNIVDLSLRLPIFNNVNARLDARNLLNAEYRWEQGLEGGAGTLMRERYRAGRVFSAGLSWRP